MLKQQTHKQEAIVDLSAPVYSATNAVLDKATFIAKPRRMTLPQVQAEWHALLANINRIGMRLEKAKAGNLSSRMSTLADLHAVKVARLQELAALMVELGGAVIHPKVEEQNRKLANWRAKDVRRHQERKASPIRYVTMPDGYPMPDKAS